MAQIPSGLITHSQKVCRLYKRALRSVEDWHPIRHEFRYEAVLMRQRFEANKNIVDARVAKQLLIDGEEELFQKQHHHPSKFINSIGGISFERVPFIQDCVVDYWHPIEKSMYPKYFAQREVLKKEYKKHYDKLFPKTSKIAEDK